MAGNINAAYQWAIRTCNAPNIQYSMDTSKRNGKTVNGITYYDCSSFIFFALKNGGFPLTGNTAFGTGTMIPVLLSLGFVEVPLTGEWKAGDIVWRRSGDHGHTEMVYTGGNASGVCMGAHQHYASNPDKDVSIDTYTATASDYMKMFRYGQGATGGGVNIFVIAAMCGCWWTESGINPAIWESLIPCAWDFQYDFTHKGGYGLGQWTNYGTPHGRCYHLHEWMTQNGYAMDDGNGQLAYVIQEDYWVNSSQKRGSYTNLSEFMGSTSTDLATLVWDFLACWEGVAGNAYDQRLSQAQQCLEYMRQHMSDDPSTFTWITGNRYLSTNERLNNAMCVYFYYSGYNINYPTDDRKGAMPVWMMCRFWHC